MNSAWDTQLSRRLEGYLNLATVEAKLAAVNMANVDTPGYRTVGFDFEAEMRRAMTRIDGGLSMRTPQLGEVDGLAARPDGNNVSMEREGLQLAKAQLRSKTAIALLKTEYQKILDAIHADSK
jgi:flagellar basal-body rod protein FlgB